MVFQDGTRVVKRRRALLESNSPRNNQLENHRNDEPGAALGSLPATASFYIGLNEAGKFILEQEVPTTREAMKPAFGKIPRSLIAMETGTHSP